MGHLGVGSVGEGIMTRTSWRASVVAGLVVAAACGGKAVIDPAGSGGTGAGNTTSSSGTGGTTTSSGTTTTCPDLPSCNWCAGAGVVDGDGCLTGWICANGADPCVTSPCQYNSDCEPDSYCFEDGLCWPCQDGPCDIGGTSENMTCSCEGPCANGMTISFSCSSSEWGGNCDCMVDGVVVSVCDIDGPDSDPCGNGFTCCDWPGMGDD